MLYRRLIINGSEYQLAVSQYGTGAPNVKTPGAVGALYMNTSDGSLYKCTSATDGRYAWQAMESQAGLTEAQIEALNGMFQVCAFVKEDVSEEYSAFQSAFGITAVKLTGISAVYTGGNVTAGTSVNALSGIVVTAHYSDGSTKTITDYLLSGTIAEGENTITVSYGGVTTTFTVTGIAEAGVPAELTSISAAYSGGDVAVGTALTDLTGIVVTANYSDGTSKTVTGYTLSGTIAEGENTITVSYGGMTTTFTVTGIAEAGVPAELTSISAAYSGGDVAVGTALTDLTGIVVTAHYSDGSTKTVAGYTLSGTIAEGNNTITVSYAGETTTFTVTGVAEGSGTVVTNYSIVEGAFIRAEGYFSVNSGYNTAYFEVLTGETYTVTASNGKYAPQFALVASGFDGDTSKTYTFLDCVNEHTDKIAVYTTTYTVPQDGCLLIPYGVASTFEIVKG